MNSYFFAFTNKHTVWILGIFALVLRLVNLDRSFWYDEGFSGHLSRLDVGSMIAFLTSEDVHPPLYFLLINLWAQAFPGDLALRWISVLLGSVSVMAFYGFSRKLFDQFTATVGTVFLALSPFHVYLSKEVRPYALYMLLSVVALWLVVKACESPTVVSEWGFAYSLTTALMLYTHNVAPLVVAGFASFHLCVASDNLRKGLRQILVYNITGLILFLPWGLTAIRQADRVGIDEIDRADFTYCVSTLKEAPIKEKQETFS